MQGVIRGWSLACACDRLLAAWFRVRSLSQASYCMSGLSGPAERRASISVIKLGKMQAQLGISLLVIKKKQLPVKFHLKFPSIRLFSLNVNAGSSDSFFFFLQDDLLKGHHPSPECPGFFKGCRIFFPSSFYKYRFSVMYWVQLHRLLSSGSLAQQFRLH